MARYYKIWLLSIFLLLLSSCAMPETLNHPLVSVGDSSPSDSMQASQDAASQHMDSLQPSSHEDALFPENDVWELKYLHFQEPEGMRYDGLTFWLVSVFNNQVFLGNTNGFVQYADLPSGEIITKILHKGVTGIFYRATKDGYIFSKSFYDTQMNPLESYEYILTKSLYDKQMNLLKRSFGPELGPNDEAWEGQWVNDVDDDLQYLLYSEQYVLISDDRRDFEEIQNGLFMYNTTNGQTWMIRPEAEFYYNIKVLPNPNYAFIYYINDKHTVRSAVLNLTNCELQLLEESEDMQHHILNGSRKYIILTNGYYDKLEQAYHLRPPAVPHKVPYIIDDNGLLFYYFDNTDDKLRLVVYNANDESMDYLDLSSKYSSGRLIDVAENGSVIVGLTHIEDRSSFGLYQITRDSS